MNLKNFLDIRANRRISKWIAIPFFVLMLLFSAIILLQSPIGVKSVAFFAPEKIVHDGSKTGPRVGYSSYCNPEEGIMIFENEKMTFVTDEGIKVLWTQGDIDCYMDRKNKVNDLTLTVSPTPEASITNTKKTKSNSDPIINCGPGDTSKQYVKDKSSNCKNYVDCGLNNNTVWTLMLKTECDKKHAEETQKGTQQSQNQAKQPTQGSSVYCWNNTYGYAYYTSSGDQCNLENAKDVSYQICMDTQKMKSDSCGSICKGKLDEDNNICAWAYTGSNATIEQSSEKYGECLNGSEGTSSEYSSCLQKCGEQYAQDIKQCS